MTEKEQKLYDALKEMYEAFYELPKKSEPQFDAMDKACKVLEGMK